MKALLWAGVLMAIATGASAQSGSVYGADQAQIVGSAERGVVLQAAWRSVEASWQERTTGAAIGSAAAYHLAARKGWSAGLAAGGFGGLLGERIAAKIGEDKAQELLVDVGGRVVVVLQPMPAEELVAGDRVYVLNSAGKTRVVRAVVASQ